MNQRLKRMISGILAVLTLFTTLFADWTPVFAASPSANMSLLWSSIFVTLLTVKIMFFTSVRIVLQKVFYNYYTNAVSHDCM